MILNSLLKTHAGSLTDESLQTLLVEVKAVVNSHPLTTETINDVTSLIPLSLINLLTIKSKIVMPPPYIFVSPDKYCRKHWRRDQHICNEFWNRWRKEVLLSLQSRTKWNIPTRNCKVGDIVLLKNEAKRNQCPMAKIVATNKDDKEYVQSVKLLIGASNADDNTVHYLERPVNKLVMLIKNND